MLPHPAEKLQNFFGVFLQFHIGVDSEKALKVACPIAKYNGKTLGEVLQIDPKALHWVATKFTGNAEVSAAAKLICDEAVKATA